MTTLRFGLLVERKDRRAGLLSNELPLLSVSQTRGVRPFSEIHDGEPRADSLHNYKIVSVGDIAFNRMSVRAGALGVVGEPGVVTPEYEVLRPYDQVDERFIAYLMKSPWFVSELVKRERGIGAGGAQGVRTTRISYSDMRLIEVPRFSADEQRAIADYLDHETAEIDAFIAESDELIRLTLERFDSQEELAANDWQQDFVKLKYLADIQTGFPFKSDSFKVFENDRVPLLRGINVAPGLIDWTHTVALEQVGLGELLPYRLEEGDLVMGMDRPLINGGLRIAPITSEDKGALLVQRVARLRANRKRTSPEWLLACLRGSRFKAYLEPDFTGVSVPHISPGQIGHFPIAVPALAEQGARLEALTHSEATSRAVVSDARQAIGLARQRRAALISAAVTGQIDVSQRHRPVAEQLEDEVLERV